MAQLKLGTQVRQERTRKGAGPSLKLLLSRLCHRGWTFRGKGRVMDRETGKARRGQSHRARECFKGECFSVQWGPGDRKSMV